HRGVSAEAGDGGFDEERHEGELGFVARFEFVLGFGAEGGDFGHVHFFDGIDVGGDALGGDHVFSDALAHGGHRLDRVIAEVDFFARDSGFEGDVNLAAVDGWAGGSSGWSWWWRRRSGTSLRGGLWSGRAVRRSGRGCWRSASDDG